MNKNIGNVIVYCPECKKRVFDKVTSAQGLIQIKCPHCQRIVTINLAFRLNSSNKKYLITNIA